MTARRILAAVLLAALGLLAPALATAQGAPNLAKFQVEDRKSGYFYMGTQTRALQDDEFLNPGVFAIDQGKAIWNKSDGPKGQSCAACHGNAEQTMKGVAAKYPRFDDGKGGVINLELVINRERTERMGAAPLEYESDALLALTTYITYQSRGLTREPVITGPAAPFFEQGKEFFFTRRGQLDLSCAQCHDDRAGGKLRGDTISQGQINGFPFYRLIWRSMGSTHRMFQWCNTSMRAEPFAMGSEEYLNLELYVAWRGRGLLIETPAVRK